MPNKAPSMTDNPIRYAYRQLCDAIRSLQVRTGYREDGLPVELFKSLNALKYAKAVEGTWHELSCDEQYELAKQISANVGYVLAIEPRIEASETVLEKEWMTHEEMFGRKIDATAWRWRLRGAKTWVYDPTDEWRHEHEGDNNIEFEPLYTASRLHEAVPAESQSSDEDPRMSMTTRDASLKVPRGRLYLTTTIGGKFGDVVQTYTPHRDDK